MMNLRLFLLTKKRIDDNIAYSLPYFFLFFFFLYMKTSTIQMWLWQRSRYTCVLRCIHAHYFRVYFVVVWKKILFYRCIDSTTKAMWARINTSKSSYAPNHTRFIFIYFFLYRQFCLAMENPKMRTFFLDFVRSRLPLIELTKRSKHNNNKFVLCTFSIQYVCMCVCATDLEPGLIFLMVLYVA